MQIAAEWAQQAVSSSQLPQAIARGFKSLRRRLMQAVMPTLSVAPVQQAWSILSSRAYRTQGALREPRAGAVVSASEGGATAVCPTKQGRTGRAPEV